MIVTAVGAVAALSGLPASAGESLSEREAARFKAIITAQIKAFGNDDAETAFSFASPGIQRKFGNPARFMTMVRRAYPAIYRPGSFRFAGVSFEFAGRPTQKVIIYDRSGKLWIALYAFERQADGSWRIAAVMFKAAAAAA